MSWYISTHLEWIPDKPRPAQNIQLHIEEVGPYSGNAFGGIEAVQLFGCLFNDQDESAEEDYQDVGMTSCDL